MHESGVGFAIKTDIVGKLSGRPNGINLFMTLKHALSGNQHTTISAYAITMTSQMKSKLSSTIIWIVLFLQQPSDKLIILGDKMPELAQTMD